jgi:hypothetical protein
MHRIHCQCGGGRFEAEGDLTPLADTGEDAQ